MTLIILGSFGAKDHLLINKLLTEDCKARHRSLSMAWVDYQKAYDSVPHSWVLQCLQLHKISPVPVTCDGGLVSPVPVTCDGGLEDIDGSLPRAGYRQDEDHADQTGNIPGWLALSSSLLYGSQSSEYGVETEPVAATGWARVMVGLPNVSSSVIYCIWMIWSCMAEILISLMGCCTRYVPFLMTSGWSLVWTSVLSRTLSTANCLDTILGWR